MPGRSALKRRCPPTDPNPHATPHREVRACAFRCKGQQTCCAPNNGQGTSSKPVELLFFCKNSRPFCRSSPFLSMLSVFFERLVCPGLPIIPSSSCYSWLLCVFFLLTTEWHFLLDAFGNLSSSVRRSPPQGSGRNVPASPVPLPSPPAGDQPPLPRRCRQFWPSLWAS